MTKKWSQANLVTKAVASCRLASSSCLYELALLQEVAAMQTVQQWEEVLQGILQPNTEIVRAAAKELNAGLKHPDAIMMLMQLVRTSHNTLIQSATDVHLAPHVAQCRCQAACCCIASKEDQEELGWHPGSSQGFHHGCSTGSACQQQRVRRMLPPPPPSSPTAPSQVVVLP